MYTAMANLPMFAATLLTGQMSGYLLHNFCPSLGDCDGAKVWLFVFLAAISTPVALLIFKTCLYNASDFSPKDTEYQKVKSLDD